MPAMRVTSGRGRKTEEGDLSGGPMRKQFRAAKRKMNERMRGHPHVHVITRDDSAR